MFKSLFCSVNTFAAILLDRKMGKKANDIGMYDSRDSRTKKYTRKFISRENHIIFIGKMKYEKRVGGFSCIRKQSCTQKRVVCGVFQMDLSA